MCVLVYVEEIMKEREKGGEEGASKKTIQFSECILFSFALNLDDIIIKINRKRGNTGND